MRAAAAGRTAQLTPSSQPGTRSADAKAGVTGRGATGSAELQDAGSNRGKPGRRAQGADDKRGRGNARGGNAGDAAPAAATVAQPRATPAPATARARRRAKNPASVKLAIACGVVLVLVAGTALYFGAKLIGRHNHATANRPRATPSITATPPPTPSPSLGPYGHIASRQDDPKPLTVAQLFPASFTASGTYVGRTASRLSGDCVDAVSGAGIQGAVSSGGCSQAARATYLSVKGGMMGTIGVFNLRTAKAASKAARAAGATDFVAQLPGRRGLTHKLGQGTGIEEGLAKGHYLILIWAELTSTHRPRTTPQKTGLERFMTELLQHSANVSLTDRMVNGTPS